MTRPCIRLVMSVFALSTATVSLAAPVSYSASLQTSRSNPVTDILILEQDQAGAVHGTVYPGNLPGTGQVTLQHDPGFAPVQTLVIGITEGEDADGNDKTQLVMFLDSGFASDHRNVPYSSVFPGARHSLTIASLQAAVGGDATELAWFTESFFSGPAAGSAFESGGAFAVAEFTELKPIGGSDTRATFEVTKDFTDGNPAVVDVSISCNTGLPLDQTKPVSEAGGVEFVVTDFDNLELDCTITEADVFGYDTSYFDGASNSESGCEYADIAHESEFSCRITNSPAPVDVDIAKEWVFEGTSAAHDIDTRYELTLYCDGEIEGGIHLIQPCEQTDHEHAVIGGPACGAIEVLESPAGSRPVAEWCKPFHGDGDGYFQAGVVPDYPSSQCWVVEQVYDTAVEVDNGCGHLTVSAGQGTSCTIVNTVFFEGIPTLSQFGVALLALLMLGAGFAGFRRFA